MWVTALRREYCIVTTCHFYIARLNYSPLWRPLLGVWKNFCDNIFWVVGDGTDVYFWNETLDDGDWNVQCLSDLLYPYVVPHVMGVLPPSFEDKCDTVAWMHTSMRAFTVASTYEGLCLMNNVECVCRGLSPGSSYSSCGCCNETVLHILRDCPPMRCFWQSIIPLTEHAFFFGSILEHWILENINASRAYGHVSPPWSCLFSSFL
ncbi:hypothetical protein V6N11_039878 [Hibiscus sabdariffa]|uniref:Reverse transcriptase zinc-binding domain-containing protein n=1 Tax=Hibiscus sabdariffa TaxID=183260 RepID=A0ABR2RG69_9ROSI